jgi:hypothetical protein
MFARLAFALSIAHALLALSIARSAELERLPDMAETEPVVELKNFTDEPGFFRRWQQDHRRRVAEGTMIETDRPSFTLSPTIVPQGWVQLETGFITASTWNERDEFSRTDIPELDLRVGILPRIELRIQWGGVADYSRPIRYNGPAGPAIDGLRTHEDGSSNIAVGLKYQVSQPAGWIPQSALVADLILPTGNFWGSPYGLMAFDASNTTAGLFDYVYFWPLGDRFAVGGSTGWIVGLGVDGSGMTVDSFFQSAMLKFFWTPRLTLFTEFYSISIDQAYGDAPNVVDFGVKWRAYNNLQYDFIAAFPLIKDASGCYTGAGVSYRY